MNAFVDPPQPDELADWYTLEIAEFRRIYEAVTAGRGDVASWAQLEAHITTPDPAVPARAIMRLAYQEAAGAGPAVVIRLTVAVARAIATREIGSNVADRIMEEMSRKQIGGHMQAIVQPGGFQTRDTLHGACALDDATAIVYRGESVVGTAFLVARDLVVTAGHVALKSDQHAFYHELADELSFSFRIYESKEMSEAVIARPAGKHALVASSLPWGEPPNHLYISPEGVAQNFLDFALIRLDQAISHVDPVDIAKPAMPVATAPLLVLGFPGGTAMRWNVGVVDSMQGVRLKHKVNTLPGMSGSACINVDGKPVAIHEGSLDDNTFSIGGHDKPQTLNRAICLWQIRQAMLAGGKDPLATHQVAAGIGIYSETLVARWARSGLRLAPAHLRAAWSRYVSAAIGVGPESQGPFRPFHPWLRRQPFEQWIDRAANPTERLCIVNGDSGTGKSFLVEIVRAKTDNSAMDVVHISATETTAWSWQEAIQKWGVEAAVPDTLRPSAGVARHDETPQAAARIASLGGRSEEMARPLFVVIDFDGSASFPPGEDTPWLPFMADLLGHSWVRLVVLGAPVSITQDLLDEWADETRLVSTEINLQHLNARDFRAFARQYLHSDGSSEEARAQLDQAARTHATTLAAFPAVQLQTAATVLAAIMLKEAIERQ
jgi:hypothetical protein